MKPKEAKPTPPAQKLKGEARDDLFVVTFEKKPGEQEAPTVQVLDAQDEEQAKEIVLEGMEKATGLSREKLRRVTEVKRARRG